LAIFWTFCERKKSTRTIKSFHLILRDPPCFSACKLQCAVNSGIFNFKMVGYLPLSGKESPNSFSTKLVNKSIMDTKSSRSPKGTKQPRSLVQHNNSNISNVGSAVSRNQQIQRQQTPIKPKSPSFQPFASLAQHSRHQPSSPKPIPQNRNHTQIMTPPRYSPNSFHHLSSSPMSTSSSRSSPNSLRSSPTRSTVSPSRSSPNNFASSTCYQPPTPSSLPKPPMEWTCCQTIQPPTLTHDPSTHLKLLLNVQA
jgi:hypothetical protein